MTISACNLATWSNEKASYGLVIRNLGSIIFREEDVAYIFIMIDHTVGLNTFSFTQIIFDSIMLFLSMGWYGSDIHPWHTGVELFCIYPAVIIITKNIHLDNASIKNVFYSWRFSLMTIPNKD